MGVGFALGRLHTYLDSKGHESPIGFGLKASVLFLSFMLLVPFAWQANQLSNTISKNTSRDLESERQRKEFKINREKIKALLSNNAGNEQTILQNMASETDDRTILIPIAENIHVSPKTLDQLSRSNDLGVALTVARHKSTRPETLRWLFNEHTYPSYFYNALSGNVNTPQNILEELYKQRSRNRGIASGLAGNSKLPSALLNKLSKEPKKHVLDILLDRADVTCIQIANILETVKSLKKKNIFRLLDKATDMAKKCPN